MNVVATLLSNWSGTDPYVCHIFSNSRMLGTKTFPLMNHAPVSTSWAEDMTASRILETTWIWALYGGGVSVLLIGREGLLDNK